MLFLYNQRHHCIIERTVKSQDYITWTGKLFPKLNWTGMERVVPIIILIISNPLSILVVLSRYSVPFQFQPVNNLSENS